MFVVIKNPLLGGFKVTLEKNFLGVRVGCENVPVERANPEALVADCAKREIVTCGNGVSFFHNLDFLVFELVSVGLVPLDMRKMRYFLSYVKTYFLFFLIFFTPQIRCPIKKNPPPLSG